MNTRYLPVLLLLLPFFAAGREPDVAKTTAQQQAKPLAFIENKGQIVDQHGNHRNGIDAKLEANGITVFVGDGAIHYQWSRTNASTTSPRPGTGVANWQASAPLKGGDCFDIPPAPLQRGNEDTLWTSCIKYRAARIQHRASSDHRDIPHGCGAGGG